MGSIYYQIAASNIKKNYRFYIPRILTETGLLGCFFILYTLAVDEKLKNCYGGNYLPEIMILGLIVMSILALILMVYTNSFLMKQRKPEFGLYHCLGMEKRHVGRVLFHESFISSIISVAAGSLFGLVMYKACALLVCKLIHSEAVTGFYYIKPQTVFPPIAVFLGIDLITFIINRISISLMKPVDLISSGHKGEREPKVKWPLLIAGVICMGAGYAISISIKSPLSAIELFFVAVLLVIFGTYFLFVSGSIFILKLLKKNERFYYTAKHMPSVSGLLYRMKQNAVGLGSITILATCILVMLSTTVSLYAGMQKTIDMQYTQQCRIELDHIQESGETYTIPFEVATDLSYKAADEAELEIRDIINQRYLQVTATRSGDDIRFEADMTGEPVGLLLIGVSNYNALMGQDISLAEDEVAYCPITLNNVDTDTIKIHGEDYKIKLTIDTFPVSSSFIGIIPVKALVMNDDTLLRINDIQKEVYGFYASSFSNIAAIDFKDRGEAMDKGYAFSDRLEDLITEYTESQNAAVNTDLDTAWSTRDGIFGLYGTFLFLGMILGIIFIFATALIIYYKQISEGYEDRFRFGIMEKIGMSPSEVKRTIRSQILLVFFLPLIIAGVHVIAASPMLLKLLRLLLLADNRLYVICAVIVYIVFAVVYALIYSGTSKTYYNIVK